MRLRAVVENIFECNGMPGHEIAHVFAVASAAIDAVPLDARLTVLDEGSIVRWVRIDRLDRPLYPEGVVGLLGGAFRK